MRIVDLIEKKRDGGTHSRDELETLVGGYVRGDAPDYQMAAWLMAVCWRGMPPDEAAMLTRVMAASGEQLDLSVIGKPVADKHSTGGVGDKTSLVVMPLVAACGVPVGKMSGRGLGFTGGTVDKLESFPGIRLDLDAAAFVSQLRDIGLVITGQSADLAPADGKLYALRDVTATVPSLPLIASSIMSKKLAAGADVIVLDVKTGSGAALQAFRRMIEAQGGDTAAFDDRSHLPSASLRRSIASDADGFVARLDALTVAHASSILGAGRERKGDPIDLAVGVVLQARVGDRVAGGQPLAVLHANDEARLDQAERVLRDAISLSASAVEPRPVILERLLRSSADEPRFGT